ncbi:MAG: hypothetical protein WC058_02160 [Phycisphaeraceae bacterium]
MSRSSGKSWLWAALLVVIGATGIMLQAEIVSDPDCPGSGPEPCVTQSPCVGVDCSPLAFDTWVCVDAGTAIDPGFIVGTAWCMPVGTTQQFHVEGISDADRFQKQRCTPTCNPATGGCDGPSTCVDVGGPELRPINTNGFPITYSSSGVGSINSATGEFTAGNTPGTATIWARISDAGECGSESDAETPHVEITVVKVGLEFMPSNNTPDIGKKICTNAQVQYKKTKWKAMVLPVGTTANITTSPNVSTSKSTVTNGEEFEISAMAGDDSLGSYQVKITHSCANGATIEDNDGIVFKINLESIAISHGPITPRTPSITYRESRATTTAPQTFDSAVAIGQTAWEGPEDFAVDQTVTWQGKIVTTPADAYGGKVKCQTSITVNTNPGLLSGSGVFAIGGVGGADISSEFIDELSVSGLVAGDGVTNRAVQMHAPIGGIVPWNLVDSKGSLLWENNATEYNTGATVVTVIDKISLNCDRGGAAPLAAFSDCVGAESGFTIITTGYQLLK